MTDRQLLELMLEKMTGLETDMRDVKTDVSDLKADVSVLKADVSVLKADVSDLKADVSVLKADVSQLKERQEAIFEQTAGLMEFRTETTKLLHEIKENQLSMADMLGDHEIQIRNLKRRVGQSL